MTLTRSSQTLPNLNTFHRTKLNPYDDDKLNPKHYQTQHFSFDSPPITTPSPINTASSPFPLHPKQTDEEFLMEELEYQSASEVEVEETTTTIEDHQTTVSDQEDDEDEMGFGNTSNGSLREPSPKSSVLFDNPDSLSTELPILSSESIQMISTAIITLAPVIGQTLCRYRAQLNEWESAERVDEPVLKASAVLDQCLLRIVMVLEPIWNQCVKPLIQLEKDFKSLQTDYQSHDFNRDSNSNLIYLNRLMVLSDSISIIKENISDLSKHTNDLYDWIDGFLTPILAELSLGPEDSLNQCELESDRRSCQVSLLLDAQSYLCIALDSLANNLNLLKISFTKLSIGFDGFINRFEHALQRSPRTLRVRELWACLGSYGDSFELFVQCLSVLASVSMAIQNDTIGTLHSISYRV